MREHQIVINLKREQFEEVQRLARLAGSKSVSAFLKDRVLSLLESGFALDGSDARSGKAVSPSAQEMLSINQELSRMHRELQVFIAESLSNGVYDSEREEEETEDLDDWDSITTRYQQLAQSMEADIAVMKAEAEAEAKAQAQPGKYDTTDSTTSGRFISAAENEEAVPTPPPFDPRPRPAAAKPQSQPGSPISLPDAIEPGTWSGFPVTNFVESAGIYTSTSAESIWLTPPGQAIGQGGQGGTVAGAKAGDYAQVNDELEDLAERAFAISPRLGTVDPPAAPPPTGFRKRQVDDPLSDLLDDNIMQQAQELKRITNIEEPAYGDGMVYAFGGPDDEAVPQEEEFGPAADQSPYSVLSQNPETGTYSPYPQQQPAGEYSDYPQFAQADSNANSNANQSPLNQDPQTVDQDTVSTLSADDETSLPPASHVPAPNPDLLAGPPPKRRRISEDSGEEDGGDHTDRFSGGPPPKRRKK